MSNFVNWMAAVLHISLPEHILAVTQWATVTARNSICCEEWQKVGYTMWRDRLLTYFIIISYTLQQDTASSVFVPDEIITD